MQNIYENETTKHRLLTLQIRMINLELNPPQVNIGIPQHDDDLSVYFLNLCIPRVEMGLFSSQKI